MTITTKFSIGDSVWVMKDGKPYEFTVRSIHTHTTLHACDIKTTIIYSECFCVEDYCYPESACYASCEELLASL